VTTIDYTDNFQGSGSVNSFAYPTQQTNAQNPSHITRTKYEYNTGLVVQGTDARGLKTTFTYDAMNRPKAVVEPNGRTVTYTYDLTPKVVEEVQVASSGEKGRTETLFDKFYRPTQSILVDPIAGNVYTDIEYDEKGRLKRVSEPYRTGTQAWTTNDYDVLDRVKKVTNPVGLTNPDLTFITHSYSNNTVTIADEAGIQRSMTSNALGQLTQVVEYPTPTTPLTTDYTYYVFGPLRQVDQSGMIRTFTYDWLGRKLNETHPESGQTIYTPDADGRVQTRTDARGKITTYGYDPIDRVTSITYSDNTPPVSYTYDQNGYTGYLTTSAVSGVITTQYAYTTAGQLASEVATLNGVAGTFTTSYGYDQDGRLTTVGYPSGQRPGCEAELPGFRIHGHRPLEHNDGSDDIDNAIGRHSGQCIRQIDKPDHGEQLGRATIVQYPQSINVHCGQSRK
jgi:YD repeat-containing protein